MNYNYLRKTSVSLSHLQTDMKAILFLFNIWSIRHC